MNMAPVLDLQYQCGQSNHRRSRFQRKPADVCGLGLATIAGFQDNRVVACGKHFPGHGDTTKDSHLELPVVASSFERLHDMELRPFRHAIDNELATIMTAHVSYPKIDPQFPATLSYIMLTDLLRDQLRFKGVVITDDLEMRAIIDHYGIEEAALLAFQAGADVLLICKEHDRQVAAMEALHRAVKDGRISETRLEASLRRIARVKERFLTGYAPADPVAAKSIVGCARHQTVLETVPRPTAASESDGVTARPVTTKELWAWCLYDFANSSFTTLIVTVAYSVYFVQIVARPFGTPGHEAMPERFWFWGYAASMVVVAVLSPVLGAIADARAIKRRFLIASSLLCVVFTALLALVEEGDVWQGLLFFGIANIAFDLGFLFCSAFLVEISRARTTSAAFPAMVGAWAMSEAPLAGVGLSVHRGGFRKTICRPTG